MSDHDFSDNEIDVESACSPSNSTGDIHAHDSKRQARAQHNALERRRRDNIKDMYTLLKDEIQNFSNDRASRAQILKKTIDQIDESEKNIEQLNSEIKQIQKTNNQLREEMLQRIETLKSVKENCLNENQKI